MDLERVLSDVIDGWKSEVILILISNLIISIYFLFNENSIN